MIVLIDNYDSFTFNLVHYLGELGAEVAVHRNDKVSATDVIGTDPDAIVLSPGPCTPNEAGICLDLVDKASATIPMFGVCLGLQSIGQAFGGNVVHAKQVMHGKTSAIHHHATGVFRNMPDPLQATRYHSLVIERHTLPECLEVTAWTDDGEIMGVRHKHLAVEGVQFHPEAILTERGHALLANFLQAERA